MWGSRNKQDGGELCFGAKQIQPCEIRVWRLSINTQSGRRPGTLLRGAVSLHTRTLKRVSQKDDSRDHIRLRISGSVKYPMPLFCITFALITTFLAVVEQRRLTIHHVCCGVVGEQQGRRILKASTANAIGEVPLEHRGRQLGIAQSVVQHLSVHDSCEPEPIRDADRLVTLKDYILAVRSARPFLPRPVNKLPCTEIPDPSRISTPLFGHAETAPGMPWNLR